MKALLILLRSPPEFGIGKWFRGYLRFEMEVERYIWRFRNRFGLDTRWLDRPPTRPGVGEVMLGVSITSLGPIF